MSRKLWNRFDRPLCLELGDSPLLLKLLLMLHIAGVSAWVWVPLSPVLRVSVVVFLVFQYRYLYRLHVRPLAHDAIHKVYWDAETGWQLENSRDRFAATLCLPVYVTARLVAVRFRVSRFRRVSVIVVSDRTGADSFRRLRVRLLQCAHGGDSVDSQAKNRG